MLKAGVQDHASIDRCCAFFQELLKVYPTSSLLWYGFAQWEYRNARWTELEAVFAASLKQSYDVRMWRLYLGYVKNSRLASVAEMSAEDLATARQTVVKAFEFALSHVGPDVYSMSIWHDYLDFCRAQPTANLYEQQQQMDQVRRIYQRALVIPMAGIESLWHEYDAYENSLNKTTAKKMLADRSAAYMAARTVLKELTELVDAVDRLAYPTPPDHDPSSPSKLCLWTKWIWWERSNPLKIADAAALHQRVMFAYRSCLQCLPHYPEVWFDLSKYLTHVGRHEDAEAQLRQACKVLPLDPMVHFTLADLLESDRNRVEEAKACYESLLSSLEQAIGPLPPDPVAGAKPAPVDPKMAKLHHQTTLAHIQYMQFCRRTEGIQAARAVFTRARKLPYSTYHAWVAAAKMEYYCKKDAAVAGKILELRMSMFGSNLDYLLEYLHYLIQLNDDQNTRALFERALRQVEPSNSLEIWKMYLDYEFRYGDLSSVISLEKRFKEIFPDQPITKEISLFTRRFSFGDLTPSEERVWLLVQPGAADQVAPLRFLKPMPFALSDGIIDLAFRLSGAYDGPRLNVDGLVKVLAGIRLNGSGVASHPAVPTAPTGSIGRNQKTMSSALFQSPTRSSDRRGRKERSRKRGGGDRPKRKNLGNPREPKADARPMDLFEQRYREREANRQ